MKDHTTEFAQRPTETSNPTTSPGYVAGITGAASGLAASTAATLSSGANTVSNTASDMYNNPTSYVPGMGGATNTTSTSGSTGLESAMSKMTLPSEEYDGQKPFVHTDGAGALPGTLGESNVALLPEEKG